MDLTASSILLPTSKLLAFIYLFFFFLLIIRRTFLGYLCWRDWGLSPGHSRTSRSSGSADGGTALCGFGRTEDRFHTFAFSRPPLLPHMVDCCLFVLHVSLWPLLPPVPDGCVATAHLRANASREDCTTKGPGTPSFSFHKHISLTGFLYGLWCPF